MKTRFKDRPLLYKVVSVFSIAISISVIVLAVLSILEIWEYALNVCIPMMGLSLLCGAYMQWEASRASAYVNICCAIIIFICAAAVFFLK